MYESEKWTDLTPQERWFFLDAVAVSAATRDPALSDDAVKMMATTTPKPTPVECRAIYDQISPYRGWWKRRCILAEAEIRAGRIGVPHD